jgi:hypothetical protein
MVINATFNNSSATLWWSVLISWAIDTSYQVLDHLDKWFQRRRFKCEKLMDDKRITKLTQTVISRYHEYAMLKLYSITLVSSTQW